MTNELIDLITYIKGDLVSQYPCRQITPEHFICGVLDKSDCIAHKALNRTAMASELNKIRTDYDTHLNNTLLVNVVGKPDFTNEMKSIIKELEESEEIVSSGHVLCKLIEKNGEIQQKFKQMRVSHQRLMVCVLACLNEMQGKTAPEKKTSPTTGKGGRGGKMATTPQHNNTETIGDAERYLTNVNNFAAQGYLVNAVKRDDIYEAIFRTFNRMTKSNVALIGESGVGKTIIARNIANLILSGNVPPALKMHTVLEFNLLKLISGVTLQGVLEARIKSILDDLKAKKKYIVVVDNLDTVLTMATENSSNELVQFLNGLLTAPNVFTIFITTPKGYSRFVDPNPIFSRHLYKINVKKPSVEDCQEMISANKKRFEDYHNIKLTNNITNLIVTLADKYIPTTLPESAFDLLDEVGATITSRFKESDKVVKLRKKLDSIQSQKNHLRTSTQMDGWVELEELNKLEMTTKTELALAIKNENLGKTTVNVTEDDIYNAVSKRINKKVERLNVNEKDKLKNLAAELKSEVIGQDAAVDEVCKVVKRQRMKLFNTEKPAVLFFGGSTGTGKTYLAKRLAKHVFGDDMLVRLDMSEYADKISVNKLYGSAAGYVGYEEGGILTEAIKNKSRCVLLLDEIEKANDEVFNAFLQIFDDGRMTDNKGRTVSFKDVVIIMTSNVGAAEAAQRGGGVGFTRNEAATSQSIIERAIKSKFKPEFLNRIDSIVYFNRLSDENLRNIVKLEIKKLSEQIVKSGYGLDDSLYTDTVAEYIIGKTSNEKNYGGRAIVRAVTKYIEDAIIDYVLNNDVEAGHKFTVGEIIPDLIEENQ